MTEAVDERGVDAALPEQFVELLTRHLEVSVDPAELSSEATFESLGLDSLALMELVVAAEQEFGIVLPEDVLDLGPGATLGEVAGAFRRAV